MDDYLGATVPRRLRLHASVQVAGMRAPARAFLMTIGCVAGGGIAVTLGADIERTIYTVGGLIIFGTTVLEGRLWSRSAHELAPVIWRYLRRPKYMRLARTRIVLRAEKPPHVNIIRRPHWQAKEAVHE